MKKCLQTLFLSAFLILLTTLAFAQSAYTDQITFDYDASSCGACGDFATYTNLTKDSFQDQTSSTYILKKLTIRAKYMSCSTLPLNLGLNGTFKSTANMLYGCSCSGVCDSVEVVFDSRDLASLYRYNGTNIIDLNGTYLYLDRIVVIREFDVRGSNNASTVGLVAAPGNRLCAGSQNLNIIVANEGINAINSLNVDWEWNGTAQTGISSSATIDTIGSTNGYMDTLSLGSKTISIGTSYTLKAWTRNPNGTADTINSNDTISLTVLGAYSDTFTVGGTSPDFSSIQSAYDSLTKYGLCGPVVLKVRDGVYNEQITIKAIPGASALNTVTLQSESADSSKVTVNYSSGSSNNYVVFIEDAGFLRFKNITFEALNTSNSRVFYLFRSVYDVAVSNCRILAPSTTSTSNIRSNVFRQISNTVLDKTEQISFSHTLFDQGAYGFYAANSSNAGMTKNIEINNCVFSNQYYMGVYLGNAGINARILNNIVSGWSNTTTGYYGVYIINPRDSMQVSYNQVTTLNGGRGLYLSSFTSSSGRGLIANNVFSVTRNSNSTSYAMEMYNSNALDIVFNSIRRSNPNTNSDAVLMSNVVSNSFYNNVIENVGGGTALNVSFGSGSFGNSDHNVYYNQGNAIGIWNGVSLNSIDDFKSIAAQDTNSYHSNPNFVSASNLRGYNVDMDGTAKVIAGISKDLDGKTRNATMPDIGAYEFDLLGLDAAPVAIIPFTPGNSCLQVVVRNMGSTTLTSLSIDWEVNGAAKAALNWSGSLAKGDTAIVCLDTLTFKRDTAYNFTIWTYAPNGGTDSFLNNDTLRSTTYPMLNGIYTIGGTSPDFNTIGAAIAALNLGGVKDSVVFRIRTGTYNEIFAINAFKAPNRWDAVVFESEDKDSSKVIITSSTVSWNTNAMIDVLNTTGLTFRHLTFLNTTLSYPEVMYLGGVVNKFKLERCHLENRDSTSTSSSRSILLAGLSSGNGFRFTNNYIRNGSYGLYMQGNNSSNLLGDVRISGNQMLNQAYMGMYLYYTKALNIEQNKIRSSPTATNYYAGVYSGYMSQSLIISGNDIAVSGGNNLWTGMHLDYYFDGDTARIYNNMISARGTDDISTAYLDYLNPVLFAYNNLLAEGKDSLRSTALRSDYSNIRMYNNNLVNTEAGYAFIDGYNVAIQSDHNNMVTNGQWLVDYDGTDYATLSAYRSSGRDSNSVSVNPAYFAFDDLHTNGVGINNLGTPLYGITTDFDGETRSATTPDIGADEFTPPAIDAALTGFVSPGSTFAADTTEIIVSVANFGLDTLNAITVHVSFNGDTLTRKRFTRTIAPGDTIHARMGDFVFRADTSYTFMAYTSLPNGVSDQRTSNDTFYDYNREAALSGVYTIGGSSPDFVSFTAAVNALHSRGIIDSVRFRVRNGTYSEQLRLGNISGAGTTNSVVFESESLDSSAVTLSFTSVRSDSNYVVRLSGASGITFRNLTFEAAGSTSFATVLRFQASNSNIQFNNNRFIGRVITSSSTNYALIYAYGTFMDDVKFNNNLFLNGSYGSYLYGYLGVPVYRPSYAEFVRNTYDNQYYQALYAETFDSLNFLENIIRSQAYSFYQGLQFYSIYKLNVIANKMNTQGTMGMYFSSCGTSTLPVTIANNSIYISLTSTSQIIGLYTYYGQNYYLLNNTIHVNNSSNNSSSRAYYNYYGSNTRLWNNIFTCNNGHPFYNINTVASEFVNGDKNNYFRTIGSSLFYMGGNEYSDVASFSAASGLDSNGFNLNPMFVDSDTLRPMELSFYKAAQPFAILKTDINGELRDTLTPDIGAYNLRVPKLDAGIFDVLVPKMPFPADTQSVQLVIRNFGTDTLTSATVAWSLNGISKTTVNWTGSLLTGDTAIVTLGSHVFSRDTAYDFRAYVFNPNSGTDGNNLNDTVDLKGQYPALSGIYTIGGASPDFSSFNDAITAMNLGGIYDSVRFDVRTGVYSEKIKIGPVLGANKKDAIIFQSANRDSSSVELTGTGTSSANYTVQLDSAIGVTFRSITFKPGNATYSRLIDFSRSNQDICFSNNRFEGDPGNTTSLARAIVYGYNYNNGFTYNNVVFENNHFVNGSYALYLENYNSSNTMYGNNLLLENNILEDQYYMGMYLYYATNVSLKNNLIYDNSPRYSSAYGIYRVSSGPGKDIITGNRVYNKTFSAMYMSGVNGRIGDTSLVANNFFSTPSGGSSRTLDIRNSIYIYVANNNVYANNTSGTAGYFSSLNSVSYVLNNNFYNAGSSNAIQYWNTLPTQMDHNNYQSLGTANTWQRNGTNYNTLAAWRTATGRDANALNVDPDYVSSSDLHIRNTDLNEAGRNLFWLIPTDIDGEARDSFKPDIGADEFEIPAANDAGIVGYTSPVQPFASGSNNVLVIIQNFGSDSLKSATINWAVNGTTQSTYPWSGGLRTGQRDTVNIGSFNFAANTRFDLDFWTTQPNGVSDSISYNDSFAVEDLYPALLGNYTVGGLLPDFATINEAVNRLKRSGIVGNVTFNIRAGVYLEHVLIESYPGAQSGRRVTFQAENGDSSSVMIRFSGISTHGNQMVYLKGVDYITFNKLTFDLSNYFYSYTAVRMDNGANNVSFSNCRFAMNATYQNWYSQYGIYSSTDRDDSLHVMNCRFENGRYGVYTYGVSNNYEQGIVIENNKFINQYIYAITGYYANGIRILKNDISSNFNLSYYGTYLYYTQGSPVFAYNKLTFTGNGMSGLLWNNHNGSSTQRAAIYNNFVSLNLNTTNSNYGIQLQSSSYIDLYYNTVNLYGGTAANSAPLNLNSVNNVDSRNNILVNNAGGWVIYMTSSGLSQSNYNDLYTSGSNFGYVNGSNYNNIGSWRSGMSRDNNSVSVNPVFFSNTDLHTGMVNLDSAGTPIAAVTDDIDGDTRNATHPDIGADEFTSLPYNMGLASIIAPMDMCNQDSMQVQVNVYNYGNLKHGNFPVRYTLDGGTTVITETFTDTLAPGASKAFEFAKKEPLSLSTTYNLRVWTDLSGEQYRANDTLATSVTNYPVPDSIVSMFPADSIQNQSYPFTLSWLPANGASSYDVYIWADTAAKPASPAFSNITAISVQVNSGLVYGQLYKWQIHAKNSNCDRQGKVQHFRMKFLPDLIVEEVNGPSSAFSGNTISVSWKVKNSSQGQASGSWWDAVYLSTDLNFDGTDLYLGAVQNPSGLNSNQNYNQSMNVTLPNGISGNYHFIVRTNHYNNLLESSTANNIMVDSSGTNVTLTPPPDLIVTSIVRQATGFSGNNSNVFYTVKNNGTGATRSGTWRDRIYLSKDTILDGSDYNLKTVIRSGNLGVDSTYSNSVTVTLPNFISGGHYFFVTTDVLNNEYEHTSENNNTTRSDSINIILTPPSDLIVRDIVAPDTVSNREVVSISFNTVNDGGTSTGGRFYDAIYVSTNSVFNSSAIQLTTIHQLALASKDTLYTTRNVTIPNNLNGKVYWFVNTDIYNQINEVSNEGNNSTSKDLFIKSPDLRVQNVIIPAEDTTGNTISISWEVKNDGPGKARNDTRTDSVFISKLDTFNRAFCSPLGRFRYTPAASLESDSVMLRTGNVKIPDGFDGDRYIYVTTDAQNEIFENLRDNNNTGGSNKMKVNLAPYPDLVPLWVSYPDSSAAGDPILLVIDVTNDGASAAKANWRDRIYLSKDSVFSLAKSIELTNAIRGANLDVDSTYRLTLYLNLPAALALGDYYFYAYTDKDEAVYEHFLDSNNVVRSNKVFIDGYPPVDLQVSCPTHTDTMYSGVTYPVSFTVTNIGQAQTGANAWGDALYLSTDTIFDATDVLIKDINRNSPLAKNTAYTVNTTVTIPNGTSGLYYLLAVTDKNDVNNDEDYSNNYRARCSSPAVQTVFLLTPPPDLQITSYNIPSTGTSGQPLNVKWTVSNKGTGATRNGSWSDRFYLSTDATLTSSDPLLGTRNRSGNLAVDSAYSDEIDLNIPASYVGNYYLFIRTDAANVEYEHNNENNNQISSIVSFSVAPPADLVVTSVTAPDSIVSGDVVSVAWTVQNTGSNPATGWVTDNIYLSLDDTVDAGDKLVLSKKYYLSLAPSASVSHTQNIEISGVALGDYYVIASTDVLNGINEGNDLNNTRTTDERVNVNVPELLLGVKKNDSLGNNKGKYYRLVIPEDKEGESILITLKADSINGDNQLYVRREALASGSQFDYKFRDPFQGNQEIIIPEVYEGTYYLYLTGKTSSGTVQAVDLLAEILPFAIRRVTPSRGGNSGEVTLKIEGSKFEDGMAFYLENFENLMALEDSGAPVYSEEAVMQRRFEYHDPTVVFATFDLNGKDTGLYDLSANKGAESALYKNAFTIVESTEENLEFEVVRPSTTRTNAVIAMTILFTNRGNNDVVNRKVQIISTQGAPIGFSEAELSQNKTALELLLEDNDGPPGRLRAGSSGSAKVYIRATTGIGIIITQ